MSKEGYKPTSGMQSAARRAIKLKEQGKDWDNAESPSNGKIMWLAWGGDAGFSWSRKIVNREKTMKKNLELNEIVEEIKDMLDDVVNPITKVIEVEDDMAKSIDPKPEDEVEELSDEDISKTYDSDNEEEDKWDNMQKACWSGYKQVGMKDKNGRRVPNCVPVKKSIFGSEGPQDLIPKNK